MRKFTVASARPGNTFSLLPAFTMVSAVVVRSMALVLAAPSSCFCTTGPNSHRFESATREKPLISGAMVSNISPPTPRMPAGSCLSSSCFKAVLIMAMALVPCLGGMDECPGVADTDSSTDK